MTQMTPALRFPEFAQSPPWETKKLGEVCEINPSTGILPESFVYIDLESVDNGKLKRQNTIKKIGAPSRAQRILRNSDIIFQMVRPYQRNNLYINFDNSVVYVASTGYAQLRAFNDSNFLYQLIHTDNFVTKILDKCAGSNYPSINSSDLTNTSIGFPTLVQEQQKIADCLSSLDDLIAAQSDQIAALKDYKKGLLQELFPAEGETTPRRRFPEFAQSPPWESKKLGEVCDVRDGTHESPIYLNSGVKFITSKNLLPSGNLDLINVNYISKEDAENYNMRSKVNVDDILFGMIGTIGRPVKVKNDDFCIKNMALIKKTSLIDQTFVLYFLSSDMFNAQLTNDSVGNSQKFIALNNLRNTIIHFPYFPEQQKIADCLSSLDDLITAATEYLETLRSHKKGLMQQLFPSTTEV